MEKGRRTIKNLAVLGLVFIGLTFCSTAPINGTVPADYTFRNMDADIGEYCLENPNGHYAYSIDPGDKEKILAGGNVITVDNQNMTIDGVHRSEQNGEYKQELLSDGVTKVGPYFAHNDGGGNIYIGPNARNAQDNLHLNFLAPCEQPPTSGGESDP